MKRLAYDLGDQMFKEIKDEIENMSNGCLIVGTNGGYGDVIIVTVECDEDLLISVYNYVDFKITITNFNNKLSGIVVEIAGLYNYDLIDSYISNGKVMFELQSNQPYDRLDYDYI